MLHNGELVIVWDVLPIGEVFSSLAELVGKGAFIPMGVEIMANSRAVLELGPIRESPIREGSFPNMEEPHLEAPVQKFLPRLLTTWVVATGQLAPSAFVGGSADLVGTSFDCLGNAYLGSFHEEALSKRWDVFGDGIFVNVLEHFGDELRRKFNCDGNLLGLQVDITYFDLVGVNGVLGE